MNYLATCMVFAVVPVQVGGPAVIVRMHQLVYECVVYLLLRAEMVVANNHLPASRSAVSTTLDTSF